ncbi:MAG: hypothetical protein BWZ10_03217 [candidate division BRC1 bacterium ADurb.BinA364]|nr:MAG: hypothetical protein BWZ10_03217 [candidate division BRC1 bacterium ADurb.BinA364]
MATTISSSIRVNAARRVLHPVRLRIQTLPGIVRSRPPRAKPRRFREQKDCSAPCAKVRERNEAMILAGEPDYV